MTIQRSTSFRGSVLAGVLILSGLAAVPAGAVSFQLGPADQTVSAGGIVEMVLRISGLSAGGSPSLGAFDVNVNFDPALLSFQSALFGDPVLGNQLDAGAGTDEGVTPVLPGQVNLYGLSFDLAPALDAFQASDFTLATLRFVALGGGDAVLSLSDLILGDGDGAALVADVSGSARVGVATQSVPDGGLPSTGTMLLGSGLVLGFLRQRRR